MVINNNIAKQKKKRKVEYMKHRDWNKNNNDVDDDLDMHNNEIKGLLEDQTEQDKLWK